VADQPTDRRDRVLDLRHGLDRQNPVALDGLALLCVDPLPSYVWYQDMADCAEQISDQRAGLRLARAIDGRGRAGAPMLGFSPVTADNGQDTT
jgi:hypothetical protein